MTIEDLNNLIANQEEDRVNRSQPARKRHLKKKRRLVAKQSRRNNR